MKISAALALAAVSLVLFAPSSCRSSGSGLEAIVGDAPPSSKSEWEQKQLEESKKVLQLLGADVDGTSKRCAGCHNLTIETMQRWQTETNRAKSSCYLTADLKSTWAPGPKARLECLKNDAAAKNGAIGPAQLGIYAAGLHLPLFDDLYAAAYPGGEGAKELADLRANAQMPLGGNDKLTQADFDSVLNWMSGLNNVETLLGKVSGLNDKCTAEIKPVLIDHVHKMQQEGWTAKNKASGMAMFACPAGSVDPLACFTQRKADGSDVFPLVSNLGAPNTANLNTAHTRLLSYYPEKTIYWTRSSTDGRFLATGVNEVDENAPYSPFDPGRYGFLTDLSPLLTGAAKPRDMKLMAARYDPAFFPDGANFMFQGRGIRGFLITCPTSALTATSGDVIDENALCTRGSAGGLYQSTGTNLGGNQFTVVSGDYVENSGQGTGDIEPPPGLIRTARLNFVTYVKDNGRLQSGGTKIAETPYFTDSILAPSGQLVVGRLAGVNPAGQTVQRGFALKLVDPAPAKDEWVQNMIDGGTICTKGHKATFSLDERLITYSHQVLADEWKDLGYANADDPKFKALIKDGASNIFVTDLLSGVTSRLTTVGPGWFAQFPHFRSDGWLYYQVFDKSTKTRSMVATDAGIILTAK